MNPNDFRLLLEKSNGYDTFMIKAQEFQESKNNSRKKKDRWNEGKVERATNAMWRQFVDSMYENISSNIECNSQNKALKWQQFIQKYQVIENFTESVSELEFQ
ncbi:hypothetical protein [Enterococcus gallinarum]|uniref:hypothetical protein n=1 Tax=Enterococcus gallinarum TaxID=1353 RepID=UPI001F59ACF9|nr:hypothetical protein [Enterococcus gallinarum]